jgi:hypothetical protein
LSVEPCDFTFFQKFILLMALYDAIFNVTVVI